MPASWEILTIRGSRLLLGILCPTDQGVSMTWARHLRELRLPTGSTIMHVGNLPYAQGRNQVAKLALNEGWNLAFLDADVLVPPDAFLKLWESGLDYVSGLYHQRYHPYRACIFNDRKHDNGQIERLPLEGWRPGDLVPATFVPTGLLLIRHRLLVRIMADFPLPFYWGVDIAPVPDYGGQFALNMSEDFTLSYRVKYGLGVQPFCLTSVVGVHETRGQVGPKYVLPGPSNNPQDGVIAVP